LQDVMANGGLTPKIIARVCTYVEAAAQNGADLIFNQCSSVGEASDIAAKLVSVPVVKVDEAMCEEAVVLGDRIGVVATVASTMLPITNLVRRMAKEAGRDVEVGEYLVDGALDILMKENNRAKHNELVLEKIRQAEKECDVIILAQGSMTVLLPELTDIKKPIFTSPRLGVVKALRVLNGGEK
ncbi:MAG TPA: aspartate/glutamate racemase family protein, partial [Clostridiaceae bacterium]|nr:aspartate/glutamate racemase family protein [Clostridiaceae bacterium]